MPSKTEAEQRGYLLPAVASPDLTCICIEIPCDKNHALAFLGQIEMLGYWWTWERDEAKTGTVAAQIWRGIAQRARDEIEKTGIFDMGCGCSSEQRIVRQYLGDDGHLHVVYEDGTDEIRDDLDPRYSNPINSPLPGSDGDVKKCVAANSIVTALQELQQDEYEALLAGTNLAQTLYNILITFIALVIAAPVLLIPGIIALIVTAVVNTIFDMLPEDFDNAFTEQTWQDLLCILFCEMGDNASFSEEQWQTVVDRVVTEIGGYAGITWLSGTITAMGAVGLTNAGRSGYGGSRDCSECDCGEEWCYEFDLTINNGGFVDNYVTGRDHAAWVSGSGWHGTQTGGSGADGVSIKKTFGFTADISTITVYFASEVTGNAPELRIGQDDLNGGQITGSPLPNPATFARPERYGFNALSIFVNRAMGGSTQYFTNNFITKVRLTGTGINPFGTDNCTE